MEAKHSRQKLLPDLGPKLHESVVQALKRLNVDTLFGERPQLSGKRTLTYSDGRESQFNLVVSGWKGVLIRE